MALGTLTVGPWLFLILASLFILNKVLEITIRLRILVTQRRLNLSQVSNIGETSFITLGSNRRAEVRAANLAAVCHGSDFDEYCTLFSAFPIGLEQLQRDQGGAIYRFVPDPNFMSLN